MIRLSLFVTALLSASIAFAGDAGVTLSGQDGTVLVNSGKQFVSAHKGQTLAPGDRILVMKGGKATLTYPNGCVSTVGSGSMVDVSAQCVRNPAHAQKVPTMVAQAVGDNDEHRNCRRHEDKDANRSGHEDNDADDCAWPPAWAVFTGWAVIVCATIVCRNDADGISTP